MFERNAKQYFCAKYLKFEFMKIVACPQFYAIEKEVVYLGNNNYITNLI